MRDAFCTSDGLLGLATDMAIMALLALSAWLVLRSGRISLGQQAWFALGAYGAGLGTAVGHWPLSASLLAAALAAAAAGGLVSWAGARLPGVQFAVATLAVAELVRLGLSSFRMQGASVPDGVNGFHGLRWAQENHVAPEGYLALCVAVLAAALLALALANRSRVGLLLHAAGHDGLLAASQGVPVLRLRVAAGAAAGALAALGGGLYAHRVTALDPAAFDAMLGIHAVGYALVGGLASLFGPLLGVALDLGLLQATEMFSGWRMVVFGGAVAAFLRWRPRGLLDEATVARLHSLLRPVPAPRAVAGRPLTPH